MRVSSTRDKGNAAIRITLVIALTVVVTTVPSRSTEAETELSRTPSLDQVVAYTLSHHPDFAALDAEQRGVTEIICSTSAWPDPQVMIGVTNVGATDWTVGTEPMAQIRLQVVQSVPRPSALRQAHIVAEHDVSLLSASIESRRNHVAADVARSALELYHFDRRIAIEQTIVGRYRDMYESAEARAVVGVVTNDELVSISLEKAAAEAKVAELIDRRPAYVAELNTLMYRPENKRLDGIVVDDLTPLPVTDADLFVAARTNHPDLTHRRLLVARAEANWRLVDAQRIPDPAITAVYAWRGDMDGIYSVSAGVALPLQMDRTRGARVRHAAAMVEARERNLEAAEREVAGRIDALLVRLRANAGLVSQYESTLIPRGEQVVAARLAGYAVGRTNLIAVLDAVRRLEQLRLDALEAEVTHRKLTITLYEAIGSAVNLAVGTPLESNK